MGRRSKKALLHAGCLTLFVVGVLCVAVRAEDAKREGDPVQAEFDRVAKMSFAEQQAWLERLEQRAARAARLTLSPEEATRQQAHTRSLLHQRMVTWKVLREVIDDTASREKAAETAKSQTTGSHAERGNQNKAATVVKPQTAKLADTATTSTDTLPTGSVKVNVEELEARIAACNLAFRELEAELAEKGAWNAAKLEPLVDRLKILVVRHDDLGLVREAVPKEQREGITKLEAPKSSISQISARVVEARNRANDPQFTGDEVERRAELTRLEAVSHRLAELAGK